MTRSVLHIPQKVVQFCVRHAALTGWPRTALSRHQPLVGNTEASQSLNVTASVEVPKAEAELFPQHLKARSFRCAEKQVC